MLNYVKEMREENVLKSITCDICKKEFDDIMDIQEFAHINLMGGYGSVFGDGCTIEIDMCQKCLQEKLGDFIRIDGEPIGKGA